ncbi:hypothetical protein A1QK_19825 [Vibrio genomosp. F10 str. 9ZD137]|nr:hypothetical protein A1QK_19825 [Vibrio genomosp. F10 str. 9ZD137]
MNSPFLDIVRSKGISDENGIDLDEYCELTDSVIRLVEGSDPVLLDELLGMVSCNISDHISRLLEDIYLKLEMSSYIAVIKKHLFSDNEWRVRTVLELIEVCESEEFLYLLNTDLILESNFASNYINSMVNLHSQSTSNVGKDLLLKGYDSNINIRTKYNIKRLFQNKFNVDLPEYEGFVDYHHEFAMKRLSSITEQARKDFRNKKFRSVICSLSQYKSDDLSPLGKKLLKLAIKENRG